MMVGLTLGALSAGTALGVLLSVLFIRPHRRPQHAPMPAVAMAVTQPMATVPVVARPTAAEASPAMSHWPAPPDQGLAGELAARWERTPPAGWVLGDIPRPAPAAPTTDTGGGYEIGCQQTPPAGWVLGHVAPPTPTNSATGPASSDSAAKSDKPPWIAA